jgi:hypothetical protein
MFGADMAAKRSARRAWTTVCVLVVALGLAACEKLPEGGRDVEYIQAIPAGYGEVVGVTPHGAHPYIAVLWFEKPDKTIVGMRIDLAHDRIIREPVVTIPRN